MVIGDVGKRFVALLMALVVLGSAVMPAIAAGNEGVCKKCGCPANSESEDVAVLEVKGLEKVFLIADILKNEDVKKLRNALNIDKMDLASAKAVKIIDNRGTAKTVVIPIKTKSGEIKLVYISAKGYVKVGAVEVVENDNAKKTKIYYLENGKIRSYTVQSKSDGCWVCIRDCTIDCIVSKCTPAPGYIVPSECDICWYLVEGCSVAPMPDNPACVGMAICFGAIATGCFCWCTYHCNKDLGQCP